MKANSTPVLLTTLLLIPTLSFAKDIAKNTYSVDGGLGMSSVSMTATSGSVSATTKNFTNEVSAYYFIAENFGIGLSGSNSKTTLTQGTTSSVSAANLLGPSITSHLSISEKINFALSASYVFGNGYTESNDVVTSTYDVSGFVAHASLPIFDNDSVSVDPYFAWTSLAYTDEDGDVVDASGSAFGVSVSIYMDLNK